MEGVGVECRTIGEREDFASLRILHDHGCRGGMGALHGGVELALGDVLDLLVYGKHDVLAGIGLLLDTPKPVTARVERDQHLARLAAHRRVQAALQAAQAFIV